MSAMDDRSGAASSASPTDARILVVLADGPLSTAAIAARLGASERTVRHCLMRLRQAGRAAALPDGRHRLADAPAARQERADAPAARQERADAPAARQERADVTAGEGSAAVRGQVGKGTFLVALATVAAIAALVARAAMARRPALPPRPPGTWPRY